MPRPAAPGWKKIDRGGRQLTRGPASPFPPLGQAQAPFNGQVRLSRA
jgi:hypothetical protein